MRKERRRHYRSTPLQGLEIRLTAPEHAGHPDERYNLAARILDVSSRGACLVTFGKLPQGAPVTVELFVPGKDIRFTSKASVRWSTSYDSEGRPTHVAGITFDKLFKAERVRSEKPREDLPAPAPVTPPPRPFTSRTAEPQRANKRFVPEEVTLVCIPRGFLKALGLASNAGRRLKDLSRSGAQISCSRRFKPGQRVDLRLEFRRTQMTVEVEGEVRWCKRDTTSLEPRYLAGVVFQNLPEGSEKSLRAIERAFIGF